MPGFGVSGPTGAGELPGDLPPGQGCGVAGAAPDAPRLWLDGRIPATGPVSARASGSR
jgi:hypothetical protein